MRTQYSLPMPTVIHSFEAPPDKTKRYVKSELVFRREPHPGTK